MAKKLLALLLAMCMIFSVCSINIFAEESTGEATGEETQEASSDDISKEPSSEEANPSADDEPEKEPEEDVPVEKSVKLDISRTYLPNATVVVTGEVKGDISGVIVNISCAEDRVNYSETISVSKFASAGVSYKLNNATVGAEYVVSVYDFDDEDFLYVKDSFVIKKDTHNPDREDDGSNKVTFWIEGLTNRYVDKTVVSLNMLDSNKRTVLGVAEYVLNDVNRNYKLNAAKTKIDRIAQTATGSTYLRDKNSTSSYLKNSVWSYFLNGVAYADTEMSEMNVKGGDEIILYFGEPGKVGYPVITVTPDNGISLNDTVSILVENQMTDIETGEVTRTPIRSAKVYIVKRGAKSIGSAHSTDSKGIYTVKATSTFISGYQGGKIMAAYYQSTTRPPIMVSATKDLETDREGYVSAYITVEGAHKTLLERIKPSTSLKIDEYDLLNYTIAVFKNKKIEYELNDKENNFTYIESKSTSGYSNENGDLTRDSGWYVSVNGDIYTPDDDLEDVPVFSDDEIIYYFGDRNTVYAYYKIDGTLKTDETVYVYFYTDPEMTDPISGMTVYFSGDGINKKYTTNSDGRIKLAVVDYKGDYYLEWGEQVAVKDSYCPEAVYRQVKLTYTGTSKTTYSGGSSSGTTTTKQPTSKPTEKPTTAPKDDEWDVPTEKPTTNPWDIGDYTEPVTEPKGPSPYFPDANIDNWAVNYVNKAYEYGLMSGTAKGYFEPQREITRAEFTAIICRLLGLDTSTSKYTQVFNDVTPTDWYYGYVMAAYNASYVTGKSATSYAPNDYITREEMAVLLSRIIGVTGDENGVFMFADGPDVSLWARIYVTAVHQAGLMAGDQFGQFLPKDRVTRQTAATVAVRLFEYLHS